MNPTPVRPKNLNEVLIEFAALKERLEEAEQTIDAIRTGEVDALVVRGQNGDQVFTLRGADEPYRIFVEQMQDGAATLDAEGTIMYCNRAFATITGEPLERIIGTNLASYLEESSAHSPAELAQSGRTESSILTSQRRVPVICSVTSVDLDSPAAFAVTIADLTQQKRHEQELTRATAELEGFCYSVSHDMRAPLRSMVSGASIVIEDSGELLPIESHVELNKIIESANYLGKLMDDLLSYSRLARHRIHCQPVDISELARTVADGITHNGYPNADWHIEPGLIAEGDPRLVEMIIENLFTNAAKFSSKSDKSDVTFGFDPERQAYFVRDQGIGFDMQYVSKLFEPFERLHGPHEYPGTGIGLANVSRIVGLHSGKTWAESEEGKGATFYFTLCPAPN